MLFLLARLRIGLQRWAWVPAADCMRARAGTTPTEANDVTIRTAAALRWNHLEPFASSACIPPISGPNVSPRHLHSLDEIEGRLEMTTAIRHRIGTYRSAAPELTQARIRPQLDQFGITRVADITGLDEIGLPTTVCYRPDGRTLVVSIGIGIEAAQSYVSAVMESIEIWHLEYSSLAPVAFGSAEQVSLGYDVRSLNLAPNSLVTQRTPLAWVYGAGLLSGRPMLAPIDAIRLDMVSTRSWQHLFFLPSSNGAATGNLSIEASLHGLLEVIERGCIAEHLASQGRIRHVNPESATNPTTVRIVEAVAQAGCNFATIELTNELDIPCFAAEIWSEDLPIRCGGFGCHIDPEVAFGRAVAEAAQSRLATISGARDDIESSLYRPMPNFDVDSRSSSASIAGEYPAPLIDSIEAAVEHCARRVEAVTGVEPFWVDLTRPDIGIPVSKIVAPGIELCDFNSYKHAPDKRS